MPGQIGFPVKISLSQPELSKWAIRLLDYFRWSWRVLKSCWPKQKFLAAKLKTSVETVQRAVKELVAAGLVAVQRRGPRGAVYTQAVQTVENSQLAFDFDRDFDRDSAPPPINEFLECSQAKTLPDKPTPKPPTQNQLPPEVEGVLARASKRIAKAKNPVAYYWAIVRSELRLHTRREQCETVVKEAPMEREVRRSYEGLKFEVDSQEEMEAFLASNAGTMIEFRETTCAGFTVEVIQEKTAPAQKLEAPPAATNPDQDFWAHAKAIGIA